MMGDLLSRKTVYGKVEARRLQVLQERRRASRASDRDLWCRLSGELNAINDFQIMLEFEHDIKPKGTWFEPSEGDYVVACPFCGNKQNKKTNFCENCGADLRPANPCKKECSNCDYAMPQTKTECGSKVNSCDGMCYSCSHKIEHVRYICTKENF